MGYSIKRLALVAMLSVLGVGCSTPIHKVEVDIDKPQFLDELEDVCERCALSVDFIASIEYRRCGKPYNKEQMLNIGLGHPMYAFMIENVNPENQISFFNSALDFFNCRSGIWVEHTYKDLEYKKALQKLLIKK